MQIGVRERIYERGPSQHGRLVRVGSSSKYPGDQLMHFRSGDIQSTFDPDRVVRDDNTAVLQLCR